jgi:hypothetical protein
MYRIVASLRKSLVQLDRNAPANLFPMAFRIFALTGNLCFPLPSAMNED